MTGTLNRVVVVLLLVVGVVISTAKSHHHTTGHENHTAEHENHTAEHENHTAVHENHTAVHENHTAVHENHTAVESRVSSEELDSVLGDWVLVWSVSDGDQHLVGNISSSQLEISLLPDNKTVFFDERNVYLSNLTSCTRYRSNMTIGQEDGALTLFSEITEMDTDGVIQHYNETGHLGFYRSRKDSLLLVYTASKSGRYLLSYRRHGSHQDVDKQKADHEHLEHTAKHLHFPIDQPFIYDGVAAFCHQESAHEEAAEAVES